MTTPPVACYQQVADRLREAIIAGEYPPGQALPSESVLAEQYGLKLDDEPVQLADSYYPLDLVRETPIAESRKLLGGTVAALERLGLELGDFEDQVNARAATPQERQALHLADGVPVLIVTRTSYTADGRPVEVSRAMLAADRHQLTYRSAATRWIMDTASGPLTARSRNRS
ncbi:MAG: GntR family transcriptional regulator [Pseudonocardiaceae bacterium]